MLELVILGSGTSGGVPRAPEYWGNADPENPKNRRSRASVLIRNSDDIILIDTSPDLRQQSLAQHIDAIDTVLFTHDHADHCHGIDDLRGFFQARGRLRLPAYADASTLKTLQTRFPYIFETMNGYPAIADAQEITPFVPFTTRKGTEILPILQQHGATHSIGFRVGGVAYSTDLNGLCDRAKDALQNLDLWVVDGLRDDPHPSHAHVDMALDWIAELKPRRAVLTHLGWELDYHELASRLPSGVEPAFDGLSITVNS